MIRDVPFQLYAMHLFNKTKLQRLFILIKESIVPSLRVFLYVLAMFGKYTALASMKFWMGVVQGRY